MINEIFIAIISFVSGCWCVSALFKTKVEQIEKELEIQKEVWKRKW